LQVMALLRSYRDQGSLIAVTHNPEILSEADLVIRMRDGQVTDIKDRVARKTEEATA
jgi:ABC-type lipoprotein export system ATPase subunit